MTSPDTPAYERPRSSGRRHRADRRAVRQRRAARRRAGASSVPLPAAEVDAVALPHQLVADAGLEAHVEGAAPPVRAAAHPAVTDSVRGSAASSRRWVVTRFARCTMPGSGIGKSRRAMSAVCTGNASTHG